MMTSQSTECSSNHLLTFCYDCGCLLLRDVTSQLQELFSKQSLNPGLCGICKKHVQIQSYNTRKLKHEKNAVSSAQSVQIEQNQEKTWQNIEISSSVTPVISKIVRHNDQSQAVQLGPDSHPQVCLGIADDGDDDDDDNGNDDYNGNDDDNGDDDDSGDDDDNGDGYHEDDDCNNVSPGDSDMESKHNIVESLPENTSASCTVNDTESIHLTCASTKKASKAASRKRLRRKKMAATKVKSKPSARSGRNKSSLEASTPFCKKTRVTRLRSGAIAATNYKSLFEGDQKSGDNDSVEEEEEKDGEEEEEENQASDDDYGPHVSDDDEEEEEYHASDDDYRPNVSDDDDDADDIDISKYIVKKNENESTSKKCFGPGVEAFVPAMQELVEFEAAAAVAGEAASLPQFMCKLCGDKFRYIIQVHKHFATYHIEEAGKIGNLFSCTECGKKFAELKYFKRHKYRHMKNFVTYKCIHKSCNFTFTRRNSLISHIEVHKGKRKLMCKTCGVGFLDSVKMSIHASTHSNQKNYSCQYCSKTFTHQHYLKNHEWQVHSGTFKCDICPYVGTRKIYLKNHMRVHQKTCESYECNQCSVTFKHKGAYERHVKSGKCKSLDLTSSHVADLNEVTKNLNRKVVDLMAPVTNIDTPFKCKHCRMVQFKSVVSFLKHHKKYHPEHHSDIDSVIKEPYKCSECDKFYSNFSNLKSHHTTHVVVRPYKCEHPGCHTSCKSKHQLYIHSMIHRERQFMCSQCGARFVTKPQLTDHQNCVHLKLKPFVCPHCSKAFSKKEKLTNHVNRTHLKLRPFVCDKCGRAFGHKTDLNIHMLYHTGEKPFKCDQCNYRCIRADYLAKHRRTHTGERPYHCDLCNTAFAHRTQLVVHQRKNHGINVSSASNASSYQAANNIPVSSSDIPSGSNIAVNVKNELESKTAVQFLHENFSF